MTPIRIGAALKVADLPRYRDWLIADQRDLEIQDFCRPTSFSAIGRAGWPRPDRMLDGFEGRLGIHGPFYDVPMNCNDPEIMPIVTNRYLTGLKAAIAWAPRKWWCIRPSRSGTTGTTATNPAGATRRRSRTASSPPATRSWPPWSNRPRISA
jgi:hypothetical protein